MFSKILIANRGEIACRVMRTARHMGIQTVAVYSDADQDAMHVAMADEAIHIGGAPARESYLLGDRVLQAALQSGAQAIHPGYGFLAENAGFCRACAEHGIIFIGPSAAAIEAMGSKSAAKRIMANVGVPLVPGYHGQDQSRDVLKKAAEDMGYPVLLKAVAGGGGKGMRQVWAEAEFDAALAAARREAKNGFGNDDMLVEKYLIAPRHVEIQVFCDSHGAAVYLFERDCSVQRRHQKVIEEAPAPGMTLELRAAMGAAAINAAKAIAYEGAGTVEFLLDSDGAFYFMEMNTRLQVEHPVTEMISGQDLVEWQLRVAAGEPLPLAQHQLVPRGHAFEARVYAEDPANDFLPVTGKLAYLQAPQQSRHVRVDTGVRQGDEVSVFYDPMIAKLVVWDESRDKALARLIRALREFRISGMTTNLDFLYNLVNSKAFRTAAIDTGFIEKYHAEIFHDSPQDLARHLPLAVLYLVLRQAAEAERRGVMSRDPTSPWHTSHGWRLNEAHQQHFDLLFNGQLVHAVAEQVSQGAEPLYRITAPGIAVNARGRLRGGRQDSMRASIDGHQRSLAIAVNNGQFSLYSQDAAVVFSVQPADFGEAAETSGGGFTAPMNGTVVTLLAAAGDTVSKGDALLVMEAMKMEHTIRAPAAGRVLEFFYGAGDLVDGGAELLRFEVQTPA
ncbi:MAG: acetyl-CoA carboxylase biotin carboxylase subunit [Pseudomonadales bacterium]|nr:acetyl-CoA carboxylase biotin carboxylase subunit [Pseudomonadales bacterium]